MTCCVGLLIVPSGVSCDSMAAIINEINSGDPKHIVTIEDPVEFVQLMGQDRDDDVRIKVGRAAPKAGGCLRSRVEVRVVTMA